MGKIKIIGNNNLNENINGESFNNITSETIFSFGNFTLTSNFGGITPVIDNGGDLLSGFVKPISFNDLKLTEVESKYLNKNLSQSTLNNDKSDFLSFVRFGSAFDFLRNAVNNILKNFPGSLYINNSVLRDGNITFSNYSYDPIANVSEFNIPSQYIDNKFNLIFDDNNNTYQNKNTDWKLKLKNLNFSFSDYVVYRVDTNKTHKIIDFWGDNSNVPHIKLQCEGDVFADKVDVNGNGFISFHVKPKPTLFEDFRLELNSFEQYMVSSRKGVDGFEFKIKDPVLLDNGNIEYSTNTVIWPTFDGYNINIDGSSFNGFADIIFTIAGKYDAIKTDLLLRFLTPKSLKTYDLTQEEKYTKLVRIYGQEIDKMRCFIDNLVYVNRTNYNKTNNLPDQIIGNFARVMGWDYFSLLNENELVESIFSIDDETERDRNKDLLPIEIDIELWRRIILNTQHFWRTKGTRDAIKSILLMVGIPEPFINISEYVYVAEGRIDTRTTMLSVEPENFANNVYPFDSEGYPKTPHNTKDFYFQLNGNKDLGEEYMNNFRDAGFTLYRTVDNKKSWVEGGSLLRRHYSTPQYRQLDSKLVLNTKVVDIALDASRGVEYDTFKYIKDVDFPANTTEFTLQDIFINVGLDYSGEDQKEFDIPNGFNPDVDDIEVRVNGILLNNNREYDGTSINSTFIEADYWVDNNKIKLLGAGSVSQSSGDIVQVSYTSNTLNPIENTTITYYVCRVNVTGSGAIIELPENPTGAIQLTINGIALVEGIGADFTYIVGNNTINITNQAVVDFLVENPTSHIKIAFAKINPNESLLEMRKEYARFLGATSSATSKLYRDQLFNRHVFRLNYRITKTTDIKVLLDGIMLQPGVDYFVDSNNNRNVIINTNNINFQSVVSVYYLVGDDEYFSPIVDTDFGIGDISELSFLEFIDLLLTKTINVKNRQTITDHKGGWYPTILRMYVLYMKRSFLSSTDPLLSNGYNFIMLYNFLGKYNSIFRKFVTQLLPTTIIEKSTGVVVRNTVFSRQKHSYKRGVSFNQNLNYLGDDGSMFMVEQIIGDMNNDFGVDFLSDF